MGQGGNSKVGSPISRPPYTVSIAARHPYMLREKTDGGQGSIRGGVGSTGPESSGPPGSIAPVAVDGQASLSPRVSRSEPIRRRDRRSALVMASEQMYVLYERLVRHCKRFPEREIRIRWHPTEPRTALVTLSGVFAEYPTSVKLRRVRRSRLPRPQQPIRGANSRTWRIAQVTGRHPKSAAAALGDASFI